MIFEHTAIDIRDVGKRLERRRSRVDAIAGLAEHLCRAGIVARVKVFREAAEGGCARGVDEVPGIGSAGTQPETAELEAAIGAEMDGIGRAG